MDIKDFSPAELRDELERRDEEERLANKPQPLEEPDITSLKRCVVEHINGIFDGTHYSDSDVDHYIYEEAVKCIYGEDIFHWIRENEC